jgi:hypothetical protein
LNQDLCRVGNSQWQNCCGASYFDKNIEGVLSEMLATRNAPSELFFSMTRSGSWACLTGPMFGGTTRQR